MDAEVCLRPSLISGAVGELIASIYCRLWRTPCREEESVSTFRGTERVAGAVLPQISTTDTYDDRGNKVIATADPPCIRLAHPTPLGSPSRRAVDALAGAGRRGHAFWRPL